MKKEAVIKKIAEEENLPLKVIELDVDNDDSVQNAVKTIIEEKRGSKELYDEITLDVGKKLASSPPPSNVYISYVGGREKYQREHYYSYNYCMENFGYNMSRKIGESVQKFIQQILKEEK